MSRFRRAAASVPGLLVAALMLIPGATVSAGRQPVAFRIGITQTATETALNPFLPTAGMDYLLLTDMYDLLIEFGPNLEPAPGLAETWDTSADGKVWTYHLRSGVTWHDGQPFTAADVAFTFEYMRQSHNPAYTGPWAPEGNDLSGGEDEGQPPKPDGSADNVLSIYDNALDLDGGWDATRIQSVEAVDDLTVRITTTEPLIVLSQLYVPIVPEHIWGKKTFAETAAYVPEPAEAVGTGPFKVLEFNPDQFMRFEANRAYWAGAPKVDSLVYQYFANDEAAVAGLQKGDVDMLNAVPPTLVDQLKQDPNVTVSSAPSSDFIELGFNSWDPTPKRFKSEGCIGSGCPAKGPTTGSLGDPWLTKPAVRAALAQLIDKQDLVDRALNGYGQVGESVVGPFNPQYHFVAPPNDPATYPGTPDAAKQRFLDVMSGLGFSDTDGDGVLNVPDTADAKLFDPQGAGKNWSLRLFVRDDDEEDKIAGELIETTFEAAGVTVDRQLVKEDPALYDATYPSTSNADMDMYIWGWGPDPDPDFILSIFACNQINSWQDVNYCDPAYDELYKKSRVSTNLEDRKQIIQQMQAKVYTESPYAVLWYTGTLEAYRSDRWQGLQQHPSQDGSLWSTWGFGPYGSRITVQPAGLAPSPAPSAAPTVEPTAAATVAATPASSGAAAGTPGATMGPVTPAPSQVAVVGTPPPATTPPAQVPTPAAGGDATPLIAGAVVVVLLGASALLYMRRRAAREEE